MTPDTSVPDAPTDDAGSRVAADVAASTPIGEANPALRARYETYRAQQGRDFVRLIPREGVRALLRKLHDDVGGFDFSAENGFEALAAHCAELLPLPPFDVWARDFASNRVAYGGPEAPPLAPAMASKQTVTVAVVDFRAERGDEWVASLEVRELDRGWTGTVRFHRPGSAAACRTGPIIRESHPESVRTRFEGFDRTTLSALLRSALP